MKVLDYLLGAFTGAMLLGSVGALVTVAGGPEMNGGPAEYRYSIWFGAIFCGIFGAGLGALACYAMSVLERGLNGCVFPGCGSILRRTST